MSRVSESQVRCGIVLAGGEGKRLRSFIQRLRGKDLPKQYVNFIGRRSMLEHTFHRAEKLVSPDRLFTVVNRDHLRHPEVWRQLSDRPKGSVIFQPLNKETGPGIMLPLMRLHKYYPDAVVVLFPSDHFVLEEDQFMNHVDLACQIVEQDRSRLVLLGVEPYAPESEYGYILSAEGAAGFTRYGLRLVSRFVEKPDQRAAKDLFHKGGLWNTMVMAFKAETLLGLARKVAPALSRSFHRIWKSVGTPAETAVVEEVYRNMKPVNFSKDLLEAISAQYSSHLQVLPVRGVYWSDWGSEHRIKSMLRQMNYPQELTEVQMA